MTLINHQKKAVITIDNLVFSYENQLILEGLSLTLYQGEMVALLGKTGAGKSTLLNLLMGLKLAQQGEILIDNLKVENNNFKQIRKKIGFAFQNPEDQLFMPTILEDVMFGLLNDQIPFQEAKDKARFLLAEFGLIASENRSSHELSGGQKRLAALAAILALDPNILILDEPTNGLDPLWRKELAEILLRLNLDLILIASHDLNWIRKTTQRGLILDRGKIQVDQPLLDLFQQPKTLEKYRLSLEW